MDGLLFYGGIKLKKDFRKKSLLRSFCLLLCISFLGPFFPARAVSAEESFPDIFPETETAIANTEAPLIETETLITETEAPVIHEETTSTDTEAPLETECSSEDSPGGSQEEIPVYQADVPQVFYTTHVQSFGWLDEVSGGDESGTTGLSKRLESIKIHLDSASSLSGSIEYRTHVQTYGWLDWVKDGAACGVTNELKRMEALQIMLTGEMAKRYDVYYRAHVQTYGWLDWAKNGESAGTEGYSRRVEAIQICLVEKGGKAPGNTQTPFKVRLEPVYQTHVQTYGWQDWVKSGEVSGTSGQSKRLEGIRIQLDNHSSLSGGIEYCTHVQTYGWQDWVQNGKMSGTSGRSKRLEAIRIRLTGPLASQYDVYYSVHAQTYGWLGWAKNGEEAGTEGLSRRLEAIRILLVPKGKAAPGSSDRHFIKR